MVISVTLDMVMQCGGTVQCDRSMGMTSSVLDLLSLKSSRDTGPGREIRI